MTEWSAVEAALQGRPDWRRVGVEWHGPCPVDGGGRDCAWFAPGSGSGGVRAGCRRCGDGGGRLDGEALRSHLAAAIGPETRAEHSGAYTPAPAAFGQPRRNSARSASI